MKAIEQFRQTGLTPPIRTRAGITSWAFFLLGGPFLIGGSVLALLEGNILEQVIGAFGLVFFGFCLLLYGGLLVRSGSRGMLTFTERGIYHALYGLEIDWQDVGPAWVYEVSAAGSRHADVMFILRQASLYRRQLGPIGKFLFAVMDRQAKSRKGGALEMGVRAFGTVAGGGADVSHALEGMRQRLEQDDDAIALGIPRIIRFGLSNDDVIEIINTTVLRRAGDAPPG